MAPPAFGMRPATKKVETPKEEIEKEIDSTSLKSQGVDFSADQGPVVDADHLSREVPADVVRENSASHDNSISSSSLSVDQPSPSLQPARAMPVPTGPRRAAPPRKKAVKSPSPQEQAHTILDKEETSVSPAQISNVSEDPAHTPASIKDLLGGDVESEIGVVNKSVDDHYPLSDAALSVPPSVPAQQEEQKLVIPDEPLAHSEQTANQSHVTHDLDLAEEPTDVPEATYDTTAELVSEPVSAEAEEDEEDEVARRKRVADKLAQMGGFNLFTGPPPVPRRVSADSIPTEVDADTEAHEDAKDEPELEESSAPPVAPRRESIEIEEAHSSSPGLEGRTSTQEGIDTAQVSYQDADAGEPEFHEVGYDVEEEAQDGKYPQSA
ncbi:hypothetical protein SERLADRAFT_453841 [Serpula lacrymans var. lacrymans S7.9]|uniref:Altered inheritance of mitochondria protein 21 n=1 Tax=Serpula lacrymans var. lacrymans (strain S7.9) TaxID=578457 RepID=F8PCI0_SERL9|nr:uncharacterized protein SERLADRAFT_453841 [Serpula lacrymans var. lacrymans S7.9]EGO19378.1 hypothetical protein SERLADRAFT_453841 [Serpula lacrymans var. lacrymans S7.9]